MRGQVLLINDMTGYGKVALSAMMPVLSYKKHHVYTLPTALVSNTLDYGRFAILETTDYMAEAIRVWEELGFSFDAISTGFIVSERQEELIRNFCSQQREKGAIIFTDPIMGDVGRLYNGVTEETVARMRQMIQVSDHIVPNLTEATYLAGVPYEEKGLTLAGADRLLEGLQAIGARSIVITSAMVEGQEAVLVYDHQKKERTLLPFVSIPVRFPGTGALFLAIYMSGILDGKSCAESAAYAMQAIEQMIVRYQAEGDDSKGILVENYIELLDQGENIDQASEDNVVEGGACYKRNP